MATASLASVTSELRKRMGPIPSKGVDNCRPKYIDGVPRPDKGWSEHSWGNAEDLAIYGLAKQKPYYDELQRMKGEGYPVGWIGWAGNRPSDHTDHIHLEGSPNHSGQTPPCAGGTDEGTRPVATTTPGDTASDLLSTPFRDDGAPKIDIPMVGDIGPVLYRGMWIAIAIVATIIAVNLITKGFLLKTGVKLATKGVV